MEIMPRKTTSGRNPPTRIVDTNQIVEFTVCGWILTIFSYVLVAVTLPLSACLCIKVVQEYERAVIFRLGRLMPGGARGPGEFLYEFLRPYLFVFVSFDVPPQEVCFSSNISSTFNNSSYTISNEYFFDIINFIFVPSNMLLVQGFFHYLLYIYIYIYIYICV
uniref:PHB domain-containing protein n=1 Tax=Heterorhabditis bacteriophora TaxID=37862 RepID=A0A1I7X5F0_HETBA